MNIADLKTGLRVRVTTLGSTGGWTVHARHLDARREGAEGTVTGFVPGHGGDVWWVRHTDPITEFGAYSFTELEPLEDQTAPVEESEPESKPKGNIWD